MFHALSWFAVVLLLALWSLATWALHGVAAWAVSNAGALSGSSAGVAGMVLPDWLAPWVPAELVQGVARLAEGLGPMVDALLQAAPALAGVVSVAAWVIWGIGCMLLVLLGAGVHLLIALWRRRAGGGSGPGAGPSMATG